MSGGLQMSVWPWALTGPGGLADLILEQLVRASIAGFIFAALVWAATRAWRGMPAGVQCALWWAVGLKFLVTLVWLAPVELPLLPAPAQSPAVELQRPAQQPDTGSVALAGNPRPGGVGAAATEPKTARGLSTPGSRAAETDDPVDGDRTTSRAAGEEAHAQPGGALDTSSGATWARVSLRGANGASSGNPSRLPWRQGLLVLWLLGVAHGVWGIRRELTAAVQIRQRGAPIVDPEIRRLFAALCRHLGIRRHVSLQASEEVGVPLTMGWLRPVVILPSSSIARQSHGELAMALGHELLHVRRLDLWAGWVPRLARCLFFFHPLAVLAAREYALAREAACDADLVRELDVAPREYGRLLVRWRPRRGGVAEDAVGCAAASSTFVQIKRRLEMLEQPFLAPRRPALTRWLVATVLLLAIVPLRLIAQAPTPPEEQDTAVASNGSGTFEQVVDVREPVRLDVVTGSGTITVRPGSTGEVRVVGRAEPRPRAWGRRAPRDMDEMLRQFETNPPVVVQGNVVRVGYDLDEDLQRYASISYQIETPAQTEVRSRTGSGGQEIAGVEGPVQADAGSGTIRLDDIGGAVRAQTGSGSIRAAGVAGEFSARTGSGSVSLAQTAGGDVEVTTGSGSTNLRGVNGAVSARAGSGSISVEGRQDGRPWELQTGSGSIRVRLPEDAGFELEAQTGSGRIQTDHPLTAGGSVTRGRLVGQVRGGGPVLRLRTGSGGVRIE